MQNVGLQRHLILFEKVFLPLTLDDIIRASEDTAYISTVISAMKCSEHLRLIHTDNGFSMLFSRFSVAGDAADV